MSCQGQDVGAIKSRNKTYVPQRCSILKSDEKKNYSWLYKANLESKSYYNNYITLAT